MDCKPHAGKSEIRNPKSEETRERVLKARGYPEAGPARSLFGEFTRSIDSSICLHPHASVLSPPPGERRSFRAVMCSSWGRGPLCLSALVLLLALPFRDGAALDLK